MGTTRTSRRVTGFVLAIFLIGVAFGATPSAQSAQIQAALRAFLTQVHTWTATQTFTNVVVNGTCTGCSGATTGFSTLSSGTNTTAAMVVGTGAAISASGSGTITATAVPVGGISGLGTGTATALAVNVGTAGAFVVNGGALGTPSSGTLTNATGLPASTGISGLGTGIATWLATPSSANLAAAVTDETGTGALVFATSPSLVTPVLGAASATGLTITGTPGVTQQRPDANTAQIFLQSTVPPAGRTNEAPFQWYQSGATFLSEWDPVMYFGYNADRAVATEPTLRFNVEGNYKTGASTRAVEMYWEYVSASGSTVIRPIFFNLVKDASAGELAFNFPQINMRALGASSPNMSIILQPWNLNSDASIAVSSAGGTGTTTNQGMILQGGSDYTGGAYVYLAGNTMTNSAHPKGALNLVAGASSSPTAGTLEGAINFLTGASAGGTQRMRIEQGGNIAIQKAGVAATAFLHLGPGTATASTAPLKFTTGTNLTTAEAGAFEYNGTNLFFTRAGTTRENVLVGIDNVAAPSTSVGAAVVNYYGAAPTNFLGDPNRWISVNIAGATYKIPLYN